jgi:DNA-binding response OmpR family regulator
LPVLYITGFSTSEQFVRDVDDGTPMLAKPFDMHDLVAAVDQLLAPHA